MHLFLCKLSANFSDFLTKMTNACRLAKEDKNNIQLIYRRHFCNNKKSEKSFFFCFSYTHKLQKSTVEFFSEMIQEHSPRKLTNFKGYFWIYCFLLKVSFTGNSVEMWKMLLVGAPQSVASFLRCLLQPQYISRCIFYFDFLITRNIIKYFENCLLKYLDWHF